MKRTDPVYWQRLRRDKRSSAAALLTILAWLILVVAAGMLIAPGSQAHARGNPLYWLVMLPFVWWTTSLASFEPGAVRLLVPAQITAPLAGIAIAIAAMAVGADATPFWFAAVGVAGAAALGQLTYRGSMLKREGPAR